MGAGIALGISKTWPEALEVDKTTPRGKTTKMGTHSQAHVESDTGKPLIICNVYSQFHWGDPAKSGLDSREDREDAIDMGFESIAETFSGYTGPNLELGIPLIGTGLAGGNWDTILPRIIRALENTPINLTIVEFNPNA